MRLLSPGSGCIEVDTPRRRYRGRVLEVTDPADVRALRAVGYTPGDVARGPTRAAGFTCTACGFNGYFRKCGQCGSACDRERRKLSAASRDT